MFDAIRQSLARDEEGATAVEYGLMVVLIAVAIIGFVFVLGQNLGSTFDCTGQSLAAQSDQCTP